MGQGDILALKSLDVAHHLRLCMVLIEDFVREEGRGSYELAVNVDRVLTDFIIEVTFLTESRSEDIAEDTQIFRKCGLIDTQQGDYSAGCIEEIDTAFFCDFTELVSEAWLLGKNHAERVEEVLMQEAIAKILEFLSEEASVGMYPTGDVLQAFGSVVDGVEATHRSKKRLSRTDITCSTLTLDMLLTRLQS